MRFEVIVVVGIFFGAFVYIFGQGFGVNDSNAQLPDTAEKDYAIIIDEIRSLLNQILIEYQVGNFSGASDLVEEAFLENYKLIQNTLGERNETLMEEIEIQLRGQLLDQVKGTDPDADILRLIEEINSNLDKAEATTNGIENNFVDIMK
jgi:hypothetical protein